MNLISLYTTRATATGGRSSGTVRTDDGALEFELRLPPELGGAERKETGGAAANPEQFFACAWAASLADAPVFAAKRRNRILREVVVTAQVSLQQLKGDGFGIAAKFEISLPELSKAEAVELVGEARRDCPYTKLFKAAEKLKVTIL